MIRVRFTADRNGRKAGEVVAYDPDSARNIVESGAAVYLEQSKTVTGGKATTKRRRTRRQPVAAEPVPELPSIPAEPDPAD